MHFKSLRSILNKTFRINCNILEVLEKIRHLGINYSLYDWWNSSVIIWSCIFASCCCSVAQLCPTVCDHMDCSIPGFAVLHYLLDFAQNHIQCQWCHSTISSSVIPFSFYLQSFLSIFPINLLLLVGSIYTACQFHY